MARTFAAALVEKYGLEGPGAEVDVTLKVSCKPVEMVGMERQQQKFAQFRRLRVVSLREEGVAAAGEDGEIAALCPGVTDLDLSSSAFAEWAVPVAISRQLQQLQSLSLSFNRLQPLPLPSSSLLSHLPSALSGAFRQLQRLVLNRTGVDWQQIASFHFEFPALRELHLESNGIKELVVPPAEGDGSGVAVFPMLKHLNLDGNELSEWDRLGRGARGGVLDHPSLEQLILSGNGVASVAAISAEDLPALNTLSLANNPLDGLNAIFALRRLQSLHTVRLQGPEGTSPAQWRANVIPRMPALKVLNASAVTAAERRDAEKLYLRLSASELVSTHRVTCYDPDGEPLPFTFVEAHPEFPRLAALHGNPLPAGSSQATAGGNGVATSAGGNVEVVLRSLCPASMQTGDRRKRLPVSCTVAQLKTLMHGLFSLDPQKQRLVHRGNVEHGAIAHAVPMNDELRDLGWYLVVDGSVIEMHEVDLEEERREAERLNKDLKAKEQAQLVQGDAKLKMAKALQ